LGQWIALEAEAVHYIIIMIVVFSDLFLYVIGKKVVEEWHRRFTCRTPVRRSPVKDPLLQ
jgi:hypothetical protein